MSNQVFYVNRGTDSVADILETVGVAEALCAWLQALRRPAYPIRLREQSNCYQIELPGSLNVDDITALQAPFSPGPGRLLLKNTKSGREQQETSETYPTEIPPLQKVLAFPKPVQDRFGIQLKSEKVEEHGDDFQDATTLDLDLGLYACLNQFRATGSYNRLWQQWHTEHIEAFRITLRLFIELYHQSPNPATDIIRHWTSLARMDKVTGPALVNRLQLVNPSAGKGGNTPKIDTFHEGNLKSFWLPEYLKFVGFFALAIPAQLKKSKDRQFYILHLSSGELSTIQKIGQNMRMAVQRHTATASDVLALLQVAYMLVEQTKEALTASLSTSVGMQHDRSEVDLPLMGGRLEVVYYKHMGSAHAMMHLATLRPPFWIRPLETVGEADLVLTMLKEHLEIMTNLSQLVYEGAEVRQLLVRYRDFLSGHDPRHFLDFACSYGSYALSRRRHGQHLPSLSKTTLEYVMTQTAESKRWSEIFENDGFEAIAGAIRRATIGAQYWAAREPGYPYEVRYGLGQALLDVADYPREFIKQLGIFLQSYNNENARIDERLMKRRISERPRYQRPSIKKEQEKALFRLFDEFPPELISTLLISYGYMREGQPIEEQMPQMTAEIASEGEQTPIQQTLHDQQESDAIQITAFEKAALEEQENIA